MPYHSEFEIGKLATHFNRPVWSPVTIHPFATKEVNTISRVLAHFFRPPIKVAVYEQTFGFQIALSMDVTVCVAQ